MSDANLLTLIDSVAKEKGLNKDVLIDTMESAILKAAQAAFGGERELEARLNQESGEIELFQYMTVAVSYTHLTLPTTPYV